MTDELETGDLASREASLVLDPETLANLACHTDRKTPEWGDLSQAVEETIVKLNHRLKQKGPGIYVSKHECLGIITEEYHELIEAVQHNSGTEFKEELLDLGVAVLFSLASHSTGEMDW